MPRPPEATRRVVADPAAAASPIAGGLPVLLQGNPPSPRLERELMEMVRLPEVHERLQAMAVEPNGGSARDLAQRVAAEVPRWTAVARSANVKLD